MECPSPKQMPLSSRNTADIFPYYAGFSPGFVRTVLEQMAVTGTETILDPWNGSGTTTRICKEYGLAARGYDINPALVFVAKSRLLDVSAIPSLSAIGSEVIQKARYYSNSLPPSDPLDTWFDSKTSRTIRRLERTTYHLLINPDGYVPL